MTLGDLYPPFCFYMTKWIKMNNFTFRPVLLVVCLVCLAFFVSGSTQACCCKIYQVDEVIQADAQNDEDDDGMNDLERVRELCIELKRQEILSRLRMQLEQLEGVLDLKENQVKKLSIAAKAVSGKRKDQWAKIMEEYDVWSEMLEVLGGDLEQLEEGALTDFSKLPAGLLYYLDLTELGIAAPGPERSQFWLKSLRSVLDDGQFKNFEEYIAKQDKELIGALAGYVVQNITRELALDDKAKEAVEKFVDAKLSDPPIRPELLTMYSETLNLAMSRLATADLEELESALNQNQLNRLRSLLGVYDPNGFMFVDEDSFEFLDSLLDEGEEETEDEMDDDE